MTALVKQVNALPTVGSFALPVPSIGGAKRSAEALLKRVWWAREELNLRPLPYQQTAGMRCANRRRRRSPSTVDGEVKCSPGVQLSALFLVVRNDGPVRYLVLLRLRGGSPTLVIALTWRRDVPERGRALLPVSVSPVSTSMALMTSCGIDTVG